MIHFTLREDNIVSNKNPAFYKSALMGDKKFSLYVYLQHIVFTIVSYGNYAF